MLPEHNMAKETQTTTPSAGPRAGRPTADAGQRSEGHRGRAQRNEFPAGDRTTVTRRRDTTASAWSPAQPITAGHPPHA